MLDNYQHIFTETTFLFLQKIAQVVFTASLDIYSLLSTAVCSAPGVYAQPM